MNDPRDDDDFSASPDYDGRDDSIAWSETAQAISNRKFLRAATSKDSAQALLDLLAEGAEATARDENGRDALMLAASRGLDENVQALLPFCNPRNQSARDRHTALMFAVMSQRLKVVDSLLSVSDRTQKTQAGLTLLDVALGPANRAAPDERAQALIVERILPISSPTDEQWSRIAWIGMRRDNLALVLAAAKNISLAQLRGADDSNNPASALFFVVSRNPATAAARAMVEALLAAGCDPRERDRNGQTLLMAATQTYGNSAVIEMLIPLIDIDARDGNGATALMQAARRHASDATRLFLAAGANPNLLGSEGETALHLAVQEEATALVEILAPGSDLSIRDAAGFTAMERALATRNFGVLDAMAGSLSPKEAEAFMLYLTRTAMPRMARLLEARALETEMEKAATPKAGDPLSADEPRRGKAPGRL